MKNMITCLAFLLFAVTSFAQQMDQQELYNDSKKTAYTVSEKMNLDEDEFMYLTRAIYSYELTMQKVALSKEANSSEAEINSYIETAKQQLQSYVNDMFPSGKATKILTSLAESLDSYK